MVKPIVLAAALAATGCLTLEDGKNLHDEIQTVKDASTKNEQRAELMAKDLDVANKKLTKLKDEIDAAGKAMRTSADVALNVQKVQTDLGEINGRIDDLQHALDALTKQFQDYRAASDTKLEQLTNTMTAAKTPPMPETADALFAEGDKRLAAAQWADARRLYEAFVNRYPTDARAAKAQYNIGEAYAGEKRYANAIGAYTKVVDNFPKSEVAPDAMYKNGLAFYQLKYCSDAKVYFQELLKRYPKNNWKTQVNEELKKLAKDQKNKAACSS